MAETIITMGKVSEFKWTERRKELYQNMLDYIGQNSGIERKKVLAYFQFTEGVRSVIVSEALDVLKELDLIEVREKNRLGLYLEFYTIKEKKEDGVGKKDDGDTTKKEG